MKNEEYLIFLVDSGQPVSKLLKRSTCMYYIGLPEQRLVCLNVAWFA
jgi:hypothetical protein